jgi:precorrin-6Y C5,15-methyltransferase (decarboxylating)
MVMVADPWLTLVGMTDDSAAALPPASREALAAAEVIFGGPRHLELVAAGARGRPWPVPFDLAPVLAERGRPVVVLTSGDPFWYGAGGSLARHLKPGEWRSLAAPSTFSLVAGQLGWRLEEVTCLGLHAAPLARLRRHLSPEGRLICLLREGAAVAELAQYLCAQGAGATRLWVCERLGGPRARVREARADGFDLTDVAAPVAVALALPKGPGLSRAAGLPDESFHHAGQITKRPVRALTLSALAPRPGAHLWDVGAGSGSISVEWALAGGRATAFERRADRADLIRHNIAEFGLEDRVTLREGRAPECLEGAPAPDAVFVGGGGSETLFDHLFSHLAPGTRLVANGVTLETEALLVSLQARCGGDLLRIELAQAAPLGGFRGWQPLRPVVQWSLTL